MLLGLLYIYFILILVLLFLILILFKLNESGIKGLTLKKRIKKQLHNLPSDEYKLFNDIILIIESEPTHIENLVVSQKGLFVIKTKAFRGWIHGSEKSKYWTQTIYTRKKRFCNPVKQIWSQINALKRLLSCYSNIPFIPMVVLANNAILKNEKHEHVYVIHDYKVYNSLMGHKPDNMLRREEVYYIAEIIKKNIVDASKQKYL